MSSPAITESSIIRLVDTFYARVRDDAVLSPVFEAKLAGRWHEHMPRMYALLILLFILSIGATALIGRLSAHRAPSR